MSEPSTPRRERVVLAQRRGARRVRTRVEVREQTEVGDALVRGLMRAQLGLALRLGVTTALLIASIPLLGTVFPTLGEATIAGIRLNWLVLGVLIYPLLYLVGRVYVRIAEQAEDDFLGLIEEDTDAGVDSGSDADVEDVTDAGVENVTDAGVENLTDAGVENVTDAGVEDGQSP